MKNLKFVGGIFLVAVALILTFLALFFPVNGMFASFWNAGLFTFRGNPSLIVFYLVSALSLVFGSYLLARHFKNSRGGV